MAYFPETNFDFPNVGNYDGDLREILVFVRALSDDYATMKELYERLLKGFEQLDSEFKELKREVERFREEIAEAVQEAIDESMAEYREELILIKQRLDALAQEQANLRKLVADFSQMCNEYTDVKIAQLSELVFAVTEDLQRQIDELRWHLPDVYNITNGLTTDLLTLVYDVYDVLRYDAITVDQFGVLGLTAAQFDAKELTAAEFDVHGYDLLIGKNTCINPFTGERDTICNIIQLMAVNITGQTITATEFDAAELTVDEFEALDLDAYQFDFYAKQYIAA
jgi:archaellum component FlaC